MLLLIFSAVVMAQGKRTITGVVTDTNGEPIVGANVVVQNNHSIGAITDIDGRGVLLQSQLLFVRRQTSSSMLHPNTCAIFLTVSTPGST